MSFSRNEVVLVPVPFTDLTSRKVRPAVIIGHSSHPGDVFVVPITSQLSNTDVLIDEWRAAGLNVACGIKSQIATLESRLILRTVGTLSSHDRASHEGRLRFWLEL